MKVIGFAQTVHRVEHVEVFDQIFLLRLRETDYVETGNVVVFFANRLVLLVAQIRVGAQNLKFWLAWIPLETRAIQPINQK